MKVDVAASAVSTHDFDATIVPGGYAPDRMRRHPPMLSLVRGIFERGGVVAMNLINAGAEWVDQEVVRDGNLISSRRPGDLPAFCRAIIAALK